MIPFFTGFFWKFILFFNWFIWNFSCLGTFFTFYLQVKVNFCLMILMSTHLKIQMIWTSLGFFSALVEFEGRLFNYLDNLMGLNCIEEGM